MACFKRNWVCLSKTGQSKIIFSKVNKTYTCKVYPQASNTHRAQMPHYNTVNYENCRANYNFMTVFLKQTFSRVFKFSVKTSIFSFHFYVLCKKGRFCNR